MLFNLSFVLAFGFFALANAHMKMSSPTPFDVDALDNSPLKPDGSDYPCKTCGYKVSETTKISTGSEFPLQLAGSAIHGGGSCQIAISMDKEPTKDSTFKVIKTYEGDCPPAAGTGLSFNIPKEFPSADRATLAWTWFNKIGNREMYMNLAPIEITGGSDSQEYFQSLPDLFKANIPASSCTTPEMSDPTIPNPGQFLVRASTYKPGAVTGPDCGAAGPDGGSGTGGGSGSGSGGASSAPGNDGMSTQPAASPAQPSSAPTGQFDDGQYHQPAASSAQPTSTAAGSSAAPSATVSASSASSAAPSSTFSTHTVTAPTYPTLSPILGHGVSGPTGSSSAASNVETPMPTGYSSGSSNSESNNTSFGDTPSDGAPGSIRCTDDGLGFEVLDQGKWVDMGHVAQGTRCEGGAILKRSQPSHPRRHARSFHKVRV